ncbi:MAG TPA: hypothetical protein VFM54_22910 [Micromonosporaceae bacterium]|nr:hypothetical protein [Micromonosporaceae bacterium]
MLPRSGDVLRVTRAASVQFAEPLLFRVIRVHDWPTYEGWAWLDGYELNTAGEAVTRRSIFVQVQGLQPANIGAWTRTDRAPRGRATSPSRPHSGNAGPAITARPRTRAAGGRTGPALPRP